jgi:hypothetical protein
VPTLCDNVQGELPKELDPGPRYKLMDVHVNLVRKEEDFRPPTPPKYIAFAGGGRTLGASSAGDAAAATAPPPPAKPAAGGELVIDATQPVRPTPPHGSSWLHSALHASNARLLGAGA